MSSIGTTLPLLRHTAWVRDVIGVDGIVSEDAERKNLLALDPSKKTTVSKDGQTVAAATKGWYRILRWASRQTWPDLAPGEKVYGTTKGVFAPYGVFLPSGDMRTFVSKTQQDISRLVEASADNQTQIEAMKARSEQPIL